MTNKELEEFNKHRKNLADLRRHQPLGANHAAVGRQAEDRPMESP